MLEILIWYTLTDKIVWFIFGKFILKFWSKFGKIISLLICIYLLIFGYSKFFGEKNFYENINLNPSASENEIKKSYR